MMDDAPTTYHPILLCKPANCAFHFKSVSEVLRGHVGSKANLCCGWSSYFPHNLKVAYKPETAFKKSSHIKFLQMPGMTDVAVAFGSMAAIFLAGMEMYNCLIAAQHNQMHNVPILVGEAHHLTSM